MLASGSAGISSHKQCCRTMRQSANRLLAASGEPTTRKRTRVQREYRPQRATWPNTIPMRQVGMRKMQGRAQQDRCLQRLTQYCARPHLTSGARKRHNPIESALARAASQKPIPNGCPYESARRAQGGSPPMTKTCIPNVSWRVPPRSHQTEPPRECAEDAEADDVMHIIGRKRQDTHHQCAKRATRRTLDNGRPSQASQAQLACNGARKRLRKTRQHAQLFHDLMTSDSAQRHSCASTWHVTHKPYNKHARIVACMQNNRATPSLRRVRCHQERKQHTNKGAHMCKKTHA